MNRSDTIVREVATAVGLAEAEAGVRAVLRVVRRLEPTTTRAISRATGLPVPIVAAVSGELRKRRVLAAGHPTRLTEAGQQLFPHSVVPDELGALLEPLAAATPRARVDLDQSHCTVETKARRACFLHERGALDGRRVLLLGDDDVMSLAFGLGRFALRALTIVDVDPALLAYLRVELRGAPFPVRIVEHDLRLPLPAELTGSFDTVFTDPPYTCEGAELFLSRAAAALEPTVGGNVFLAFGPKPPDEALRLQSAFASMGFVIRSIELNFNDYVHASLIGGTSHLYHLTSTRSTAPLITGTHEGRLFTGEGRPARPYRCVSCGTTTQVGRGASWATVEALKADGCPACGGARFRPRPRDLEIGRASA